MKSRRSRRPCRLALTGIVVPAWPRHIPPPRRDQPAGLKVETRYHTLAKPASGGDVARPLGADATVGVYYGIGFPDRAAQPHRPSPICSSI